MLEIAASDQSDLGLKRRDQKIVPLIHQIERRTSRHLNRQLRDEALAGPGRQNHHAALAALLPHGDGVALIRPRLDVQIGAEQ
jgi:hypothetical protein